MGLLDKANRRKCYPVELSDRKVYVRSMKNPEIRRMKLLAEDLRTPFIMGCCLVLENGTQEMPPNDKEEDVAYAERVDKALDDADVDVETTSIISQAIGKIGKVDVETLKGN